MGLQKAQGSLEYLLLIGGAVIVAAIVLVLIISIANSGKETSMGNYDAYEKATRGYVVKFSALVYNFWPDCGGDGVVKVFARVGATRSNYALVPRGNTFNEYEVVIPSSIGTGSKLFELRFDDCAGNPAGSDDNLRVKKVEVHNAGWASATWYKEGGGSWTNGTEFDCFGGAPCAWATLNFS